MGACFVLDSEFRVCQVKVDLLTQLTFLEIAEKICCPQIATVPITKYQQNILRELKLSLQQRSNGLQLFQGGPHRINFVQMTLGPVMTTVGEILP